MSHQLKQLKFIVTGGAVCWWLDVKGALDTLLQTGGWASFATFSAIGLGAITVAIFLYLVVVLPRIKGVHPDYSRWRSSEDLSFTVPVLTTTIVSGWGLLLFSFASWTTLNLLQSFAASVASYALVFGLIGLIPVPHRSGSSSF